MPPLIHATQPVPSWRADILASVDLFNRWFMQAAPQAFKQERQKATITVEAHLQLIRDGYSLTAEALRTNPELLSTLRMATCPPIARDRLAGLAGVSRSVVETLEKGKLPRDTTALPEQLARLLTVIRQLLDDGLFTWLGAGVPPTEKERFRAASVVADRLCGALADPIVRNAQEQRQLTAVQQLLETKGYRLTAPVADPRAMPPGTFCFRMTIRAGAEFRTRIPVDVVIQPQAAPANNFPLLIEAKSAGDFANVNKRRKEEAQKLHQLRAAYGDDTSLCLLLCGYFDSPYLAYSASEGLDWIWEHRLEDLNLLGL